MNYEELLEYLKQSLDTKLHKDYRNLFLMQEVLTALNYY